MRMYWLAVGIVIGCGKAAPERAPSAGSGSGSGSALTTPAGAVLIGPLDAAPAALDAAPAGPALPDHARCTGRWTAKLEFADSCNAAKLAPYRELDLVLAATPQGWTTTHATPAGLQPTRTAMSWDASDINGGSCHATIEYAGGPLRYEVELRRGGVGAGAVVRIQFAEGACIATGHAFTPTFVADAGGLPPIATELAGLAGTYDLAIAWPAITCPIQPAPTQSFAIAVDRTKGDTLAAANTPWKVDEIRYNGASTFYLRTSRPLADDEHLAEQDLALEVVGDRVSGQASFDTAALGDDEEARCARVRAKVTGTRR